MHTPRARSVVACGGDMKKLHGIRHFFASFGHSMSGLRYAVSEAAIRQELVLGGAHFAALWGLKVPFERGLLLTALWFLILITEVLNTGLEAVVDLASPDYHELAKRAKDLGSFAVFLALVLFFVSWPLALIL